MKAVTIRVNDVEGVGGFVLPGDRVDVALTRQIERAQPTTDVVLQNVRVLAIDQTADERAAKASVAKSVTLEVDTVERRSSGSRRRSAACRCCCARPARRRKEDSRITLKDLSVGEIPGTGKHGTTTITVTRPKSKQDYSVPVERPSGDLVLLGKKEAAR